MVMFSNFQATVLKTVKTFSALFLSILFAAQSCFADPGKECQIEAGVWQPQRSYVQFEEINIEKALPVCKSAVETHPQDMEMNALYCRVLAKTNQLVKAALQCQRASQLGSTTATMILGALLFDAGESSLALEYWLPAAQKGNVYAQMALYQHYATQTRPLPGTTARQWLEKAAEQGYPVARVSLIAQKYCLSPSKNALTALIEEARKEFTSVNAYRPAEVEATASLYHDIAVTVGTRQAQLFLNAILETPMASNDERQIKGHVYLALLSSYGHHQLNQSRSALAVIEKVSSEEWAYVATHEPEHWLLGGLYKMRALESVGDARQIDKQALMLLAYTEHAEHIRKRFLQSLCDELTPSNTSNEKLMARIEALCPSDL